MGKSVSARKNRTPYNTPFFSPKDSVEDLLLKFIKEAKVSLDIAIYSLTLKSVFTAISEAVDRGVMVRMVADRIQAKSADSCVPKLQSYMASLQSKIIQGNGKSGKAKRECASLPVSCFACGVRYESGLGEPVPESKKMTLVKIEQEQGSMHNKYIIRDGKDVLIGSSNFTFGGTHKNRENMIILRLKYVVEEYSKNFEDIWGSNS